MLELKSLPSVTIVILNWNGWQDTIECLESLRRIHYPNYQVVIIDNGSSDDSVDRLRRWARVYSANTMPLDNATGGLEAIGLTPDWALIPLKKNLGFSSGNNVGINWALHRNGSCYVFLLNNDAFPDPNCLNALVKVAEATRSPIVGAVIKAYADKESILFEGARFPAEIFYSSRYKRPLPSASYWEVDRAEASGMLIQRDFLMRRESDLKYFLDPNLFMYGEELDLCCYARKQGCKVIMAGEAIVYHKGGRTSGGKGSPLSYYYLTRNRIILAKRLLPWCIEFIFHAWYAPSRTIRIVQAFMKRKPEIASAILCGLVDGYQNITGEWKIHDRVTRTAH